MGMERGTWGVGQSAEATASSSIDVVPILIDRILLVLPQAPGPRAQAMLRGAAP